jgi:hypothetical protein
MSDVYGLTKRYTAPVWVQEGVSGGQKKGYWVDVHLVTYDGNWEEFETEGIYVEGSTHNLEALIDGSSVYEWLVTEAAVELDDSLRMQGVRRAPRQPFRSRAIAK